MHADMSRSSVETKGSEGEKGFHVPRLKENLEIFSYIFNSEATRSLLQVFDSAIVAQNIQKQYLS